MSKTKRKAKVEYTWRGTWAPPVPAQAAGEELDRIARAHGGTIRPADVVDESRPEEAPLHPCFEWDDQRAADLYREEQARHVIRSVQIVDAGSDGTTPPVSRVAYVCVDNAETETRGYVPTEVALADDVMRQQVLAEALTALRGLRKRYAHLKELAGVFEAIDALPAA